MYRITNFIAKIFDFFNPVKREKIQKRRNLIAKMNKADFIYTSASVGLEADLILYQDEEIDKNFYRYLVQKHVRNAEKIFDEKKAKGYFDELNILIK